MEPYVLVQLSDLHLTTTGTLLPPGVRPRDNLVAGLELLAEAGIRPDALVLTGDLADEGEVECYADLAGILEAAPVAIGAAVMCLPGNHDDRAALRSHLLGAPASEAPLNVVHFRRGLRLIGLDSSVPGEPHGELSEATLAMLSAELSSPAPDGTVLALHHPPIASPIEPMASVALRNPERLEAALAGSDVRLVLCGHNHHAALGVLGRVPVWVSPATAYRADVTSRERFRPVSGCALSMIELGEAGPIVTVVPVSC